MTQASKPIDITKTFIPGDPNAFPNNIIFNAGEDQPSERNPILAYEGWNFLPTNYGVKSYFGTNGELNVDALTSNIDWVLLYQKKTLQNFLIVLADDGIWTKDSSVIGAWVHEVTLTVPAPEVHNDWTWCVIGEDFYAYRQAGANVYKISPYPGYWIPDDPVPNVQFFVDIADVTGTIPAGTYTYFVAYKELVTGHIAIHGEGVVVTVPTLGDTVDLSWIAPRGSVDEYTVYRINGAGVIEYRETNSALLLFTDTGAGWAVNTLPVAGAIQYTAYQVQTKTPNTLNMVGQLGIFKAGSRLGFWDSDNSFAWSGLDDKFDYVPSLRTLANAGQKFDDVIGKVVTVKSSKENFIIYSTKSIVFIQRNITEAFIWKSLPITNKTGIAYPREVTTGTVDTEHFAWTGMGLMRVENNNYEIIVPGVTDFLKESKDPIYLHLLQNRYLFLALINPDYIYGKVSFQTELVLPLILDFQAAFNAIQNPTENPCQTYTSVTASLPKAFAYKNNQANFNTLVKATGGAGLGFPIDKDVPVYRMFSAYYLNGNTSKGGGGTDEEIMTFLPQLGLNLISNLAIIDDDLVSTQASNSNWAAANGLGLAGANFIVPTGCSLDFFNSKGSRADPNDGYNNKGGFLLRIEYLGSITDFLPRMMQYWSGTERISNLYFTEKFKIATGTQTKTITNTHSPAVFAANLNGFSVKDNVTEYPVEFYPENINVSSDYYIVTIQFPIKRLAIGYNEITFAILSSLDLGGGNWQHDVKATSKTKTEYFDLTLCDNTTVLTSPTTIVQARLDSFWNGTAFNPDAPIKRRYFEAHILADRFIRYNLDGSSYASATPGVFFGDGTTGTADNCPLKENSAIEGASYTGFNTVTGTICGFGPNQPIYADQPGIVIPASSFLLQHGSPAPLYPTFEGALVYDLQLKKWGKYRGQFKELLDYSPINNIATGIVPYEVFGVEGAALKPTGKIASFDEAPDDSFIKYGKIGYTRAGFTDIEEIIANFRRGSTGTLGITASLDSRSEEASLTSSTIFTNAMTVTHGSDVSAKWISITLTGLFDLQSLEFKGHRKSRR